MAEKRSFAPPLVGGSSLLVIFAVLCLTVFALLTLSTVQANVRLSDASARAITGYYQADAQAEEILAGLRDGQFFEQVTAAGDVYSYTCPISDTQTLEVEVRVTGADYHMLRWQVVSIAPWQPDESVTVWDGEVPA